MEKNVIWLIEFNGLPAVLSRTSLFVSQNLHHLLLAYY